ncbi:MAG TPA: hypothetical protein VGQ44_04695 [Gemmatimonadaceae bacterium]|nr:hypothetical protein [Gemmatimonadaceae bacterium]
MTSSSGTPLAGVSVQFTVSSGTATVTPGTATTDATGQAKATVTLGSSAGNISITATVAGSTGSALSQQFVVTAGTSSQSLACSAGSPQTPSAGAVVAGVSGTGICLGAAAGGSDYAVAVFFGNPNQSALGQVNVTSHGATGLSTPDVAPLADVFATPQRGAPLTMRVSDAQEQFDLKLRRIAKTQLAPLVPSARAAMRGGARRNVIPSTLTLNQIVTLNAQGEIPCSSPINIGARVAAISNASYVLADTANPPGGFSDADYASFAAQFDTLINPLDIATFGTPTDIDHNGKIIMIFTKEVNKLTPRGANGVVGGFFFDRDLFPTTTSNGLGGCATSNLGEMFYLLVPDPNAVFSDKRPFNDIQALTPGTLAHEEQHLINAGRRLYVNTTSDYPEATWLNEGLSHIAEELLFYKATGLAPRQNIDLNAARTVATQFSMYQGSNFGRYNEFLSKPAQTSPYADNDDLNTRGATWNLLRYLADHKGSGDGSTWSTLVNAVDTGQTNVSKVFGSDWLTQTRDWATSVFSDDVPGVTDARFLEQSWNMRSIFPGLANGSGGALNKFPLNVTPLSDALPANLLINAGGVAYLRFTVPAGGQASIDWTTAAGLPVSPFFQFTVVRTR